MMNKRIMIDLYQLVSIYAQILSTDILTGPNQSPKNPVPAHSGRQCPPRSNWPQHTKSIKIVNHVDVSEYLDIPAKWQC